MSIVTNFPPDMGWAVLDNEDFHSYRPHNEEGATEVSVLVQIGDDGRYSGGFRIALGGAALRASFSAAVVLPLTGMKEFTLELMR